MLSQTRKQGKTTLVAALHGLLGKEGIAGSLGSRSSPIPGVLAVQRHAGRAKLKESVKDKYHCLGGLFWAVWDSSGSRTARVPSPDGTTHPCPHPHPAAWGLEVTPEPGPPPRPLPSLAAQEGLSEVPGDLGDILGAAGSTSSRSGPTSVGPTGLPEPCSSTTCLTADLILINRPIV